MTGSSPSISSRGRRPSDTGQLTEGPATLRLDDPLRWSWLPLRSWRGRLAPALVSWLKLDTSMTRALAEHFGAPMELQLLRAGPVRATPMERRRLELRRPGARVYGREIELCFGGAAVLRARSVTRLRDPTVPLLAGLGRRPLAELLFEAPRFRRDRAMDLVLPRGGWRPAGPAVVGRVCRWELRERGRRGTLLVEEYFQPALLARLGAVPRRSVVP